MAAEQLQAMTGMSADEAEQYLDMAGGDIESAVNLYFGMMGDSGGGGGGESGREDGSGQGAWPAWFGGLVVPKGSSLGAAWLDEEIKFSEHKGEQVGLVQRKNGPCGVLALVNAVLVGSRLARRESPTAKPFTKREVAETLAQIILRSVKHSEAKAKLCTWKADRYSGDVAVDQVDRHALCDVIEENYDVFTGPGSLVLLILSCVESHGPDAVRSEILASGGEPPLIGGPHALCTSELLMLMLTGVANGSVGAYSLMGGKAPDVDVLGGVGLLSHAELESGIPVRDQLKSPKVPVWILHGGDHFTLLFKEDASGDGGALRPPVELLHFNGLPPNGPRLARLRVEGTEVSGAAPAVHREAYTKPVPGEIEDVVQAHPEDRAAFADDWQSWRYECVLAIDDPGVSGPARTADMPAPQIFDQGEVDPSSEWRCASCYRSRFQTMCFGQNPAGAEICQHCLKPRAEAGWTIWLGFGDLPAEWRRKMARRHAPKLVSLLQTKWPECEVELVSSTRPAESKLPAV